MIQSCDVGSLPFANDFDQFSKGAATHDQGASNASALFEKKILDCFLDKLKAGIQVPNYPQFRDMTLMFLDMIEGLSKVNGSYVESGPLSLKQGKAMIPEVSVIKARSREVFQQIGEPFQLRICMTGPYTMSSLLAYKDKNTFTRLGDSLTSIIEANIFKSREGNVHLVSVDEPVLGFIDDPLLDRGSEGRESLLKAWEKITQKIAEKGAKSCFHLHNTSEELFWEVRKLDVIESHVEDPFYQSRRTKERLESMDKSLKASIAVTDFDQLIRATTISASNQSLNETVLNEKVAETWNLLSKKQLDPTSFVEDVNLMRKRLSNVVSYFGENRVLFAGTECGLRSFPTYHSAIECLRRVAKAVQCS